MFVHKIVSYKPIAGITLAAAILALSACGKTQSSISTADRVKLVEEKQNAGDKAKTPQATTAPTSAQAAPSKSSAALR